MNRNEVLNSISLKKRFCKDMNLPITLFDNPYFSQRLMILSPMFGCVESFDQFVKELGRFKNEEEYFAYYNDVKEKMICQIRGNQIYNIFSLAKLDKEPQSPFVARNLYVETNDNKTFISIDMNCANFSVLHMWDSSIFNDHDNWYDFVADYTDLEHIRRSKYIRQVVLGACSPGKQIYYEGWYMKLLAQHIVSILPAVNIYSVNVDEILIEMDNDSSERYTIKELKETVHDSFLGPYVKIKEFDLHKLQGIDGYVLNVYDDVEDYVVFKCINGEIFHQVLLHYYGFPIKEDDLVFYHNGKLARFLEPIPNPWEDQKRNKNES